MRLAPIDKNDYKQLYKKTAISRTIEFGGYNRRGVIDDGEMRDMYNLSSEAYPAITQRKPRGYWHGESTEVTYVGPREMLVKSHFNKTPEQRLAVIDGDGTFYYDGVPYIYNLPNDTRMVAINTKICLFGTNTKKYFKLVLDKDETERVGNIEEKVLLEEQPVCVTSGELILPMGDSETNFNGFKVGDAVNIKATAPTNIGYNEKLTLLNNYSMSVSQRPPEPNDYAIDSTFTPTFVVDHTEVTRQQDGKYTVEVFFGSISTQTIKSPIYGDKKPLSTVFYPTTYLPSLRKTDVVFTEGESTITLSGIVRFGEAQKLFVREGSATATVTLKCEKISLNTSSWEINYQHKCVTEVGGTEAVDMILTSTVTAGPMGDMSFSDITYKIASTGEAYNPVEHGAVELAKPTVGTEGVLTFPCVLCEQELEVGTIGIGTPELVNGISAVVTKIDGRRIAFNDLTFIKSQELGMSLQYTWLGTLTIERTCPDMEFVLESNNRLFGVSNADNCIYACKLGDPTNWHYYQNTSIDSYYAEQGSDGEWTGVAQYSSHLLFFKEDCLHKLYGSFPAEYQIITSTCNGVEKGSHKSIAFLNDAVFYKSKVGIMAYSGASPIIVSQQFGNDVMTGGIATTDGRRYYIGMNRNGDHRIFVYDTETLQWHIEDESNVTACAYINGKVIFATDGDGHIIEMNSSDTYEELGNIEWFAEFGPFDEFLENNKIYSSMCMRLSMDEESEVTVKIAENEGDWEEIMTIPYSGERSQFANIVPRRCECFSIRLEGHGRCDIKSLTREYRIVTMQKENY